jgi:hypothetical protein
VFFVQGVSLCRLQADNTVQTLYTGIVGAEIAYEYFNGVVYFSDGVVSLRVTPTSVTTWGLDVPLPPVIYAAAGTLPAGDYLVATTSVDDTGRESGSSEIQRITLTVPSGIYMQEYSATYVTRVYISTTNGATLFLATTLASGSTLGSVTALGYDGNKPLDTQSLSPPPVGRIIRQFKGRMYIASGPTLYYTEPYAFDHVHLGRNFFQFPADVTVVEPVSGGLWVVADQTYFFQGSGPNDYVVLNQLNYGAVFGTSRPIPNTNDVLWYSDRGLVMGTQDGQVTNLQEANVAAGTGDFGAAIVREQNGLRQMVVSVANASVSPLAASTFFSMDVAIKGGN